MSIELLGDQQARLPEVHHRQAFRLLRVPGDGYPLIESTVEGLRRGLVFICFARSITTQFEFITRAWTTNLDFPRPGAGADRLRDYEHVLCGGYFFIPPIRNASKPWSWILPEVPIA